MSDSTSRFLESSKSPKYLESSLSQLLAATICQLVCHPLDLLKTRLQVVGAANGAIPLYKNSFAAIRLIARQEGISCGVFKGLSASIIASGLSWGGFRFFFEFFKTKNPLSIETSYLNNALASSVAGFCTVLLFHPIWLVKTRLQLQSFESKKAGWTQYRGVFHCLKTVSRNEGFTALYRGLSPSLAMVSQGVVQMVLYEELKRRNGIFSMTDAWKGFVFGGLSKLGSTTIMYPLQLIRSRQQMLGVSAVNLVSVCLSTIRREGILGVYSGYFVQIQRSCLHNGLLFFLYELFSTFNI
eukprot:GHVL01023423.1.p1 GENE.GHVL01023423.1~~GHVL01023423.1.p1  ORF type:complete len:298 (+),score=27.08 GHVL01023423.1:49-942(+)